MIALLIYFYRRHKGNLKISFLTGLFVDFATSPPYFRQKLKGLNEFETCNNTCFVAQLILGFVNSMNNYFAIISMVEINIGLVITL